jgi:hypothetical protein
MFNVVVARCLNHTERPTYLRDQAPESQAKTWTRQASNGRDTRLERGAHISWNSQLSGNGDLAARFGPFGATLLGFCATMLIRLPGK